MRIIWIIVVLLIGVLLILGACAKPAPTPPTPAPTPPAPEATPVPGPDEVWIVGREFRPSSITVLVGTTVTWNSKSFEEHSVTSNTRLFNGYLGPLGSFSYTFTERGAFSYYCEPHPSEMAGTVFVK